MRAEELLHEQCTQDGWVDSPVMADADVVIDLRGCREAGGHHGLETPDPDGHAQEAVTGRVRLRPLRLARGQTQVWGGEFTAAHGYLVLWQDAAGVRYLVVFPHDMEVFECAVTAPVHALHRGHECFEDACAWWSQVHGSWLSADEVFLMVMDMVLPVLFAHTGTGSDVAYELRCMNLAQEAMRALGERVRSGEEVLVAEAMGLLGIAGAGFRPDEISDALRWRHGALTGWALFQWSARTMPLEWVEARTPSMTCEQEWDAITHDMAAGSSRFTAWLAGATPSTAGLLSGLGKPTLAEFLLDHDTAGVLPPWQTHEVVTAWRHGATAPSLWWRVLRLGFYTDPVLHTQFADYTEAWLRMLPLPVAAWCIADGLSPGQGMEQCRDAGFDPWGLMTVWALQSTPTPVVMDPSVSWEQRLHEKGRAEMRATLSFPEAARLAAEEAATWDVSICPPGRADRPNPPSLAQHVRDSSLVRVPRLAGPDDVLSA